MTNAPVSNDPPIPTRGDLTEQVHVLVDENMRAYLLGRAIHLADIAEKHTGLRPRPAEGNTVRDLLVAGIQTEASLNPALARTCMDLGSAELLRRRAANRAGRRT